MQQPTATTTTTTTTRKNDLRLLLLLLSGNVLTPIIGEQYTCYDLLVELEKIGEKAKDSGGHDEDDEEEDELFPAPSSGNPHNAQRGIVVHQLARAHDAQEAGGP
jgi:hypothetical protein